MALHQHCTGAIGEARGLTKAGAGLQRNEDLEAFRTGRLQPALELQLQQEIADGECRSSQRVGVLLGGIEVEHAQIRMPEVRHAGRPGMWRDAVLVREPQERANVCHERMLDRATLLRDLHPFEPLRESLGDVFLKEPLRIDP